MNIFIAVDIGGTRMRAAAYPADGITPIRQKRIPTAARSGKTMERLAELIASLIGPDEQVAAIGAAIPGPLDPEKGVLYFAPNIPGWENLPMRSLLEARFHVPVRLGNDANLAALGEWQYGAGRGHRNLLYFTISTGIGGGVIAQDRLLLGAQGLAAEVGHVVVDPSGPLCGCGHPGHLESYSSGTAIARFVREELARGVRSSLPADPPPTTVEIAAAANQGDALALAAFERAGLYLGIGVSNYLHIFNPSIVIFGGGVSRVGELLFAPMRATLAETLISPAYLSTLQFALAALGDDAGLLGALALARAG